MVTAEVGGWGGQSCPTTSRNQHQDPSRHWTLAGVPSEEWGLAGGRIWKFVREERSQELEHKRCLELACCLPDALGGPRWLFSPFLQPEHIVPQDSLADRPGGSLSSPDFTAPQSRLGGAQVQDEDQEPSSPPAREESTWASLPPPRAPGAVLGQLTPRRFTAFRECL